VSNEIVPYQQLERMATTVAKSGLFGMKTPEQALSLMLLSQAEGIHPMIAVRDYHIIQGRPSLKTDTMLARFQAAGGKVEWHALTVWHSKQRESDAEYRYRILQNHVDDLTNEVKVYRVLQEKSP